MHVENERTAVGDPASFQSSGFGPPQGRLLVVVMHGWMGTPTQMHDVVQAVRDAYAHEPALDLYVPPLPYAKFFSFTPAEAIVSHLLAGMDALCRDPTRYTRIVLIGFSLGAIFTRRFFLAATDIAQTVPDAPPLATLGRRPWADTVTAAGAIPRNTPEAVAAIAGDLVQLQANHLNDHNIDAVKIAYITSLGKEPIFATGPNHLNVTARGDEYRYPYQRALSVWCDELVQSLKRNQEVILKHQLNGNAGEAPKSALMELVVPSSHAVGPLNVEMNGK